MELRLTPALRRVAAGSVLVIGLAACGQQAPSVTEPAGTAAQETVEGESAGDDGAVEAGAEEQGGFDAPLTEEQFLPALLEALEGQRTVSIEMALQAEGMPMTLTGAVDMNEEAPAMEVSMTAPGMEQMAGGMGLVLVDGTVYASIPGITEAGTYVAIEAGDPMMGELGSAPEQMNPQTTLDAWQGMTDLEYVGQESIEGESLDHYVVTVDVASALEAHGEVADQLSGGSVEYEVWLDEELRMRQLTFELAGTSAEIRMSGWGEPVDITAPDEADIVEFPLG